jgi:hypothetical protein
MNSSSASPSCAQKLKDIFFREQKFYNAFVVSIWSVFLKKLAAFSGQAANAGPRVTIVRKHKCNGSVALFGFAASNPKSSSTRTSRLRRKMPQKNCPFHCIRQLTYVMKWALFCGGQRKQHIHSPLVPY